MPTTMRGVGQRIATIRRARRMTQADLARAAYVSLATIKGIERGARSPSDDTLDSIAAALAVDPSHIVVGSTRTDSRVHAALPGISAAIAAYDVPTDDAARPLDELGEDSAGSCNGGSPRSTPASPSRRRTSSPRRSPRFTTAPAPTGCAPRACSPPRPAQRTPWRSSSVHVISRPD
ncbi:helix-turn-helix domain-containing protein [Streptomyces glycanivorans]|uniref:Helix-turn-helix transcriptional regulator n=1 Tax=Streptomyces glycanivorans TaxID=3033808 RepID=A0ABY9JNA7_9ACTN|nr:helix-turn-helix transcriptional regulator [Streptomyces sp. Alt3]WLQ69216.1 helix-turn-helix transcriptional regulator [Streptomyces sp. Alt3]